MIEGSNQQLHLLLQITEGSHDCDTQNYSVNNDPLKTIKPNLIKHTVALVAKIL